METLWNTRRGQSVDAQLKMAGIKRPATDKDFGNIRINEPFLQPSNFTIEVGSLNEEMILEPKL